MIFVETPTFTKRVLGLLSDDSYGALQKHLAERPDDGDIIRSSGGLRKIRWAAKGHGKRGGVRVIYYWWMGKDRISMLYIYPKNELDDLSAAQLKLLRQTLEL
ncbi:MAG TPA: type II toxin-antitoxin system RelE/ParE family toxin [Verrucomicrobiae bacterium]|nr:type II toxin-antitoxin system RelE/ParE family toxin [Verrucomicrobiae bacterium]